MNSSDSPNAPIFGFNVFGFLNANTEAGNAARNAIRILMENEIPVSAIPVDAQPECLTIAKAPYAINLFYLTPAELDALIKFNLPGLKLEETMNAIVATKELTIKPDFSMPVLDKIDLILAPTHWIEHSMTAQINGIPVRYFPQTSIIPQGFSSNRTTFNLPENTVLFFTDFDISNDISLKKAWNVLNAFHQTFSVDDDVALVIKIKNETDNPSGAAELKKIREFALNDAKIILRDQVFSHLDTISLCACCDITITVNSSDGIGLNAMEAMLFGKPVLAVAWSGNSDFMNDHNACLVPFTLSSVAEGASEHTSFVFAEPEFKALCMWMHRLTFNKALRYKIGSTAQADMLVRQAECRHGISFKTLRDFKENLNAYEHFSNQSKELTGADQPPLGNKPQEHFSSFMDLLTNAEHDFTPLSLETFLNRILQFVENKCADKAVSFYDKHRKNFTESIAELDKADLLIRKLKLQLNNCKKAIHVLMPFTREENREWYAEHLKQFPVVWHTLEMKISNENPIYKRANSFINTQVINDEDYFCFLCDDDAYEPGFFDDLPDADVIYVSMKRGDVVCGSSISRHPTNTLYAKPENIKVCQVGFEQYIVKGRIFKKMRFNTNLFYADGEMAIWLKNNCNCVYEPQRFVLFNYLEPGRYLGKSKVT